MTDIDDDCESLGLLLRERVHEVHPDLDRLAASSRRAGSRIRQRRQTLVGVGGLAALGAVGAVGWAVMPGESQVADTPPGFAGAPQPSVAPSPMTGDEAAACAGMPNGTLLLKRAGSDTWDRTGATATFGASTAPGDTLLNCAAPRSAAPTARATSGVDVVAPSGAQIGFIEAPGDEPVASAGLRALNYHGTNDATTASDDAWLRATYSNVTSIAHSPADLGVVQDLPVQPKKHLAYGDAGYGWIFGPAGDDKFTADKVDVSVTVHVRPLDEYAAYTGSDPDKAVVWASRKYSNYFATIEGDLDPHSALVADLVSALRFEATNKEWTPYGAD